MNARILVSGLGLFAVLLLSACGDSASDSITSTDVTCLHLMEAGGSCNGSSSSSSTVTVSSVNTVTATSSSVTTVTTVGTSDLTLRPSAYLASAR